MRSDSGDRGGDVVDPKGEHRTVHPTIGRLITAPESHHRDDVIDLGTVLTAG
jgi:hypothetical protein